MNSSNDFKFNSLNITPIPISDFILLPMNIFITDEEGNRVKKVTSIYEAKFKRLGYFEDLNAYEIIKQIKNFFKAPSKELFKQICTFLCVKETNVLYENIVQIYEHIHAFRSTDENRKNIMFVNSFLKEMTASYVNDQECMFAQSNETDEIFPEIPIFLNENKWDLHIAPIYNNGIILFYTMYKCSKCEKENFNFISVKYTFVPDFVAIINELKKTSCDCKTHFSLNGIRGISYHFFPDKTLRYNFRHNVDDSNRITFKYKGRTARIFSSKSQNDLLSAKICLNANLKIKNTLPEWIDNFHKIKADSNKLEITTQKVSKDSELIESTPEIDVKLGDVFYSKNKSICNHHFYRVISVESYEVDIQCTECEQKRHIFKSTLIENYKFAYHSDFIDSTKSSQKKIESSPSLSMQKKKISVVDVIVLSTSKKCSEFNHTIVDYIGILPVYHNDQCKNLEINIGYCKQCNKYIMLTSDYIKINGSPICEVRDQITGKIYNKGYNIYDSNSTESVLHSYGYNVRAGNGLSSIDRRNILLNILKNGVCSKSEIISHLDYCINMASGKSNMSVAIHKWKSDLQFIREYKINAEKVAIGSITLKYNKIKHR